MCHFDIKPIASPETWQSGLKLYTKYIFLIEIKNPKYWKYDFQYQGVLCDQQMSPPPEYTRRWFSVGPPSPDLGQHGADSPVGDWSWKLHHIPPYVTFMRLTDNPSKHKTFVYHLYNNGSTSQTLGRRCINVIQMFCVCWADALQSQHLTLHDRARILVQVTINRRLRIGRDDWLLSVTAYFIWASVVSTVYPTIEQRTLDQL